MRKEKKGDDWRSTTLPHARKKEKEKEEEKGRQKGKVQDEGKGKNEAQNENAMPAIMHLPVTDSDAYGIHIGVHDVKMEGGGLQWRGSASSLSGWREEEPGKKQAEAPSVTVAAVSRDDNGFAAQVGRDVAARCEDGLDSGVVLYGPAPGSANDELFVKVCEEVCRVLRRRMDELADAQDAAQRVQQYQAEHQLTHAAALARRKASLGELEREASGAQLAPRPPQTPPSVPPSAAAIGLQRRLSSRQARRPSLQRRASITQPPVVDAGRGAATGSMPSRFRDAVRRASQISEPGDVPGGISPPAAAVAAEGFTFGRSGSFCSVEQVMPPAEDPLQKLVRRASQREGITDLGDREGHLGVVSSLHFDGLLAHVELKGIRNIGREAERLGVEFWVRTQDVQRKTTILQLLGNKMETVHIMLNQDLEYDVAPGVVYCRVKDQLFNELEVVVDTNETITNGSWHHVRWVVDDLQEDRTHFWLDGVPLRVKVGAHTCPYKFDGWGDPGEEGEVFGAIGADLKALRGEAHTKPSPFRGELAEMTIWGGDRVLNYWPMSRRSQVKGDVLTLHDFQGGSSAEMKDGVTWVTTDWPQTSLLFDGKNYINCGTMASFGTQVIDSVTIDLWFTTQNAERPMSLLHTTDSQSKQQVVQIAVNQNEKGEFEPNKLMLRLRDRDGKELCASPRTSVDVCDGSWHRLLWVIFDVPTNSMRVEVDGASADLKMGRLDGPSNFGDFTEWVCLGAHNNHGAGVDSFFEGSIKALKIWEGKGRARLLLAHLKLDEGPGATIALDSSGNGHNGVVCRVPPSAQGEPPPGRRGSLRLGKRRASVDRLRNARDVSYRHAAWLPLPQPHVNDRDIEEERLRRKLLVRAHGMMSDGQAQQDISMKVACLEVTAQESGGQWGECVIDLLHDSAAVTMTPGFRAGGKRRRLSSPDTECVPAHCFVDIMPQTLSTTIMRAQGIRMASSRNGHQVLLLWLGEVRVCIVQLQGRPASHRLTAFTQQGRLEWSGPVTLAGADAKAKHVLLKGLSAAESVFGHVGLHTPLSVARAAVKAQRAQIAKLGETSAVARCLEHVLMRRGVPAELLVCFHATDREQTLTAMKLCHFFDSSSRRLAALLVQKVYRGFVGWRKALDRRIEVQHKAIKRKGEEKASIVGAMAANADWALMKVYYRMLLRHRNLSYAKQYR
eukprot:TRINITY_DN10318_c0_g1_i3.p1 TRINITY_DN10318_c0_g1~~TRINITY_DN10318_c0_g1_i3.p1  ORF type:complete len:1181 (+),score=360.88 TRINITY_DN10318_c0_g1_i3:1331-4873(+)